MQEYEYTQEEDEEWNRLESKQSFPFPSREQMERLEREANKVKGSLGPARISHPMDQED